MASGARSAGYRSRVTLEMKFMQSSGLHRYTLAVAVFSLLSVTSGAVVTSYRLGQTPGAEQLVHRAVAALAGFLTIGLAFWLSKVPDQPWFSKIGWSALALMIAQAAIGMWAPSAAPVHAILAQIFFGLIVAAAIVTAPGWCSEVELIEDHMRPPMRIVAAITLVLVLVQIVLGAAVRHKLLSALSHIGFALLVALVALLLGMCVLHQAPEHRQLRPAAITLLIVTGVQIFLGFTAFILTLMISTEAALPLVIVTAAHVTNGALTLGSTVLVALEVQRYMRAPVAQRVGARPTVAS